MCEKPPFWTPEACGLGGGGSRASAGGSDCFVRSPGESDCARHAVRGNGAHPGDSDGHGKTTGGLVLEHAEQTGVFCVDASRLTKSMLIRFGVPASREGWKLSGCGKYLK